MTSSSAKICCACGNVFVPQTPWDMYCQPNCAADRYAARQHGVAKRARVGYVYFAEAVGSGLIKIGKAKDPTARLSHLSSTRSFKMKLRNVIQGGRAEELRWHNTFSHLRGTFEPMPRSREWFMLAPDLVRAIAWIPPAPEYAHLVEPASVLA